MIRYLVIICVPVLCAVLGCVPIYTSTYGVVVDERNVGTIASDQKIKLTIQKELLEDSSVSLLDFSVYCYNGNVYIVGEFESQASRERALAIARSVAGVRSVTPYLLQRKQDDSCGPTDNLAISAKISAKLIGDKDIMSTNVDVKVVRCHAVLLGIVGSKKEIAKAVIHAKSVSGIRGVTSFLKPKD